MKTLLLLLFILGFGLQTLAQQQLLFMRNAIYQDSNKCAFLLKPSNKLLLGTIFFTSDVTQKLADSLKIEGFVYPVGLDSNKVVGYQLQDLALEFGDSETIHPWGTTNNISRARLLKQKRRKSYRSFNIVSVDSNGRITKDYQPFYDAKIDRAKEQFEKNNNLRSIERPKKFKNYNFYYSGNSLYVFNQSLDKIIQVDDSLLQKTKISISKPLVYSNKGKYLVKDQASEAFYLIVQTNFEYNIYEMNIDTGKTKLLYTIAGVNPNPNWRIENGMLSYSKDNNAKTISLYEDIKE